MNRIAELRKQHNLTQTQLAEMIGVKPNTISQYESGIRRPNSSSVLRLASLFCVSTEYLLGLPIDETESESNACSSNSYTLSDVKQLYSTYDIEISNLYLKSGWKLLKISDDAEFILGWFDNREPPALENETDIYNTDIDPDEYL